MCKTVDKFVYESVYYFCGGFATTSGKVQKVNETVRVTVTIPQSTLDYLKGLGDGNLSRGVFTCAALAKQFAALQLVSTSSDFVVPVPDPTHKKPRGALTQKELQREIDQRVMAQQIAHREAAPSPIVDIADVDPEELARVFAQFEPPRPDPLAQFEPPRPDPLAGWSE